MARATGDVELEEKVLVLRRIHVRLELSALFCAAGALALVARALVSMLSFGRVA